MAEDGKSVADACQRMLLDTDAGQKLAEFGAQSRDNRSILRDVKKWVAEFMDRMRKIFRNVESDTLAAKEFNRFDQNTKQTLADMFVDMSLDAGEKLSAIKEAGMTEKITTDQGGVKYKATGTRNTPYRKPAYNEWDVSAALDDALDHADLHNDNLIKVGNMPNFVTDLIGIEGEFYIQRNHTYENMVSKKDAIKDHRPLAHQGKDAHFHNLGKQRMIEAILALEYPIMTIADNQGRENPQIVMILPVKGNNGAPLYAALSFYSDTKINGKYSKRPHIVLTISERGVRAEGGYDGYLEVINKAINESNVLSCDKEKMRDYLSVIASHTRVGNITEKSLTTNIAKFREFVNDFRSRNKISYKLPGSRDAADRGKLVDLFEQMVTSSNEYKALENYRKNINQMIALEEQIERLGAEIRKLSFAEGPKDMEYIKNLKLQRQKAINRLNNYDNILLRLEKSGVLKGLIDRYRAKITQQSFDKAREYYRERNERRENEIRQYYRESRRQAVERHDASQMRQRLKRVVRDLWKLQEIERLYEAYSAVLNVVKKDEVVKQGNTENGVTQSSRSSIFKITDMFTKINPEDKRLLEKARIKENPSPKGNGFAFDLFGGSICICSQAANKGIAASGRSEQHLSALHLYWFNPPPTKKRKPPWQV